MLTRLLVLAAVIAAFFVFVPTSSAQTPNIPADATECVDIVTQGDLLDCLNQLEDLGLLDGLLGNDGGNDDDNVDVCPDGTVARQQDQQTSDGQTTQDQQINGLSASDVPPEVSDAIEGARDGDGGVGTTQVTDGLGLTDLLELLDTDLLGLLELLFGDDDEENNDNVVCEPVQTGDNTEAGEGDLGFVEGFDPGGDDGFFPEGGIESGYGPTRSDEAGVPLAAPAAALLALVGVLTTGLVVRRRRSGS